MQDDTFPPVIFFLLLSNALIFAAGQFIPQFGLIAQLKFSLFSVPSLFEIWQPVTYAFLHANRHTSPSACSRFGCLAERWR